MPATSPVETSAACTRERIPDRRAPLRAARALLLALATLGLALNVWAETSPFDAARQLEQAGQRREAFLKYLASPGGEYAAAAVARTKPAEYLDLLRANTSAVPAAAGAVVEGDLLLALGRKDDALASYRRAAPLYGTAGDYPVEPPVRTGEQEEPRGDAWQRPARPFELGPGSHRDNWLIRRFITLEAWRDAGQEFPRIWELHRQRSQPHVCVRPVSDGHGAVQPHKYVVRTAGFDGQGLQFALDYAFFLKRQQQAAEALAVLREPFLQIDMDRNPDTVRRGEPVSDAQAAAFPVLAGAANASWGAAWGLSVGVSRKEFIRLAYGEFKTAGQEDALVAALQQQLAGGALRTQRLLARVRLHQGRGDDALQAELAYIAGRKFDPCTTAFRRGLAYEDARQPAAAAAEYERVLALPYTPPDVPDKDEEQMQRGMPAQRAMLEPDPESDAGKTHFQADILDRLHRLYAATGQMDRVLDVSLRQMEANPALQSDLNALEQLARGFQAAGQSARFEQWLRQRAADTPNATARANLLWLLHDAAGAAKALAETGRVGEDWKERFRRAGKAQFRLLLQALVAAQPKDAHTRLELLDLEDRFDGPDVVAVLEMLLGSDAEPAFERGKGSYNRTQFKNYYDLAYRLLRLYEKNGQLDKLRALGLRIAAGAKPFGRVDLSQYTYHDRNDLPEHGNACLALAIQYADRPEYQAALAEALKTNPWIGARAQLERRRAAVWPPATAPAAFGWAHAPAGVRLLASVEDVLCVAADERYVYAGHPWGVAVYDLQGTPVTRVALGEAARAIAAGGEHVWVGTPKGLFRIARRDWTVVYQRLDGDVPADRRYGNSSRGPADYWFDNGVYTVALDGDELWMGLHRNVQRLNVRTLELRAFSFGELKIDNWAGYDRILPDGEFVWADSPGPGLRRYDRAAGTWAVVAGSGPKQIVHLIGIIDGQVWGHIWLNDALRDRPCRIDRRTLQVTPVTTAGSLSRDQRMINGPFTYAGKLDGRLVFNPGWPLFALEPGDGQLHLLDDPSNSLRKKLTDVPLDGVRLPDGTVVAGARTTRTRFEYPHEDWSEYQEEMRESDGGLRFTASGGAARRVSSALRADTLRGANVLAVAFDDARNQSWLCTDCGVALLDREQRVAACFDRSDGLCANRVVAGVELDGRLCFATGWGNRGGGLAVFDPATRVFTSRTQADGLAADKLAGLAVSGRRLKVTYWSPDPSQARGSYQVIPPGVCDPLTGVVVSGGAPRLVEVDEIEGPKNLPPPPARRTLPYLGGFILGEQKHGGRTYLCGTRGLVILERGSAPAAAEKELGARLITDPRAALLAEAEARNAEVESLAQLQTALRDPNPYYRAQALAAQYIWRHENDMLPALIPALADPELRVRCTALYQLTRVTGANDVIVPALQARLADADPGIRAVATVELARRGVLPDLKLVREILEKHEYGNLPFGATSTIGVAVSFEKLSEALASIATPEVFALLLEFPPYIRNDDNEGKVYSQLGAALRRHPKAAQILLAANDQRTGGNTNCDYCRNVFRFAGKEMLPILHQALTSQDRVIRSNAARACGAIGDPSSVAPLIRALDLESGLSRASIVWALGELKAAVALPQLAALYVDARNDEHRRAGAGFRMAQHTDVMQAQYTALGSLDTVSRDWDELKASALAKPADPRRDEHLLASKDVFEAVRKIGPAAAQDFYRVLAADRDHEARAEAAVQLAECDAGDREKNVMILRNLLADADERVRLRAAVSLLLLGQDVAQRPILEWLAGTNEWRLRQLLEQLARVPKPATLQFVRERLKAIAADTAFRSETRTAARRLLGAKDRQDRP